jgi:hypothetical protein
VSLAFFAVTEVKIHGEKVVPWHPQLAVDRAGASRKRGASKHRQRLSVRENQESLAVHGQGEAYYVELGPWVRLRVCATQSLGGNVRVDLGRGQGGMSQQLLYLTQIGAAFEQVGGGAVA